MNSITEENYLKALYYLSAEKGTVTIKSISNYLKVKMPTVVSMMKNFLEKELIVYESHKPIFLTEKGKQEAILIIRKHRLTELYLVEKMGFLWHEVHPIAEQIEHINSPVLFEKMDEILGYPKFDPHGSPIPDNKGKMQTKDQFRLNQCKANDKVKLSSVIDSSSDFLKFLDQKKIALGCTIQIIEVESFDRSVSIEINGGKTEHLSAIIAEKLLVEINI